MRRRRCLGLGSWACHGAHHWAHWRMRNGSRLIRCEESSAARSEGHRSGADATRFARGHRLLRMLRRRRRDDGLRRSADDRRFHRRSDGRRWLRRARRKLRVGRRFFNHVTNARRRIDRAVTVVGELDRKSADRTVLFSNRARVLQRLLPRVGVHAVLLRIVFADGRYLYEKAHSNDGR